MPAASGRDRPADLRDTTGRHPPGRPTPPASQPVPLADTMAADAPAARPRRGARRKLVVREHDALTGLDEDERRELERFARAQPAGAEAGRRPVLMLRNGQLHAQNHVGIIETRRGTVVEILPKIDLANVGHEVREPAPPPGERAGGSDSSTSTPRSRSTWASRTGERAGGPADASTGRPEDTRRVFLTMLRDWRGLGQAQLDAAAIRSVCRFDMLEAFVHLFLTSVILLTRRGLARAYRTREANLPCLRGRILFPPHVRENLVDRSRFYVGYDEFTADRPANRLIHLALRRLAGAVRHPANRQRVHQLRILFSDVPPSTNLDDDWTRHRVDRSMRHYEAVMPWVRLFLFGHGLATFAGPHVNRALLFPMEEVFEDFVTAAVRRHQRRFTVRAQGPVRPLAVDGAGEGAFRLKPDIVLTESGQVRFILDAKWKRLDPGAPNQGVSQDDAYQLFAYGKRYGCRRVVLVYPRTTAFRETIVFRFIDDHDLEMACFPFDVENSAATVDTMMRGLLC